MKKKVYMVIFNFACASRPEVQEFCEDVGSYWYAPFINCVFFNSALALETLSAKFDIWFSINQHDKKIYLMMECNEKMQGVIPSELIEFIKNPNSQKFS